MKDDRFRPDAAARRVMPTDVLAELTRARALFQARTVAMVVGAPMPDPVAFKR